ncbi:hypothetical protein ACF0H5_016351 [Mactra antiquata]
MDDEGERTDRIISYWLGSRTMGNTLCILIGGFPKIRDRSHGNQHKLLALLTRLKRNESMELKAEWMAIIGFRRVLKTKT